MTEVRVPFDYRESHYSTKLWKAFLAYLTRHYDRQIFFDVCDEMGMPSEHLLRDDNWVSNKFTHEFVEKLIEKTGNAQIARDVGRMIVSPDTLGPIEYELLQSLGTLFLVFYRFPSEMKWTNRVSSFKTLRIQPGYFRFSMEPLSKDVISSPYVCENLMGALEGGGRLFDADKMVVSETECIHRGGTRCVFEARYSTMSLWKKRGLLFGSLALIALFGKWLMTFWLAVEPVAALTLSYWFTFFILVNAGFMLKSYLKLRKHIAQYHDQSHAKARELEGSYRKLDRRYQELNTLNELGLSMVSASGTGDIIDKCIDSLANRFKYARCLVMLLNSTEDRLTTFRFRGFESVAEKVANFSVAYDHVERKPGLFADILARGEVTSVFDVAAFRSRLKPENQALVDLLKISSLVCCPLQDKSEKFGLLVVGSADQDSRLNQDDVHLLSQIGRVLSIHFKTMKTLESERTAKNVFRKYVPHQVLESLEVGKANFEKVLKPKNAHITSLFADLRNFTRSSETLPPERVVEMLNRYCDFVTRRVSEFGGIIDKLVGDEVVAFFTPTSANQYCPEKAAMEAALKICSDLRVFNKELKAQGFAEISMGLGMSSGNATIGNVGSQLRLNYTAIGDTVNLASRLQALTKTYFDEGDAPKAVLIVTEEVFNLAALPVPHLRVEQMGIRGRERRENICVIDLDGEVSISSDGVEADDRA